MRHLVRVLGIHARFNRPEQCLETAEGSRGEWIPAHVYERVPKRLTQSHDGAEGE